MTKRLTSIIALVTILCLLGSVDVYAGKGSNGKPNKKGFFAKIGSAIKNTTKKIAKAAKTAVKKTGKAIKKAAIKTKKVIKTGGAKITNGIMDSGVWIKWKLTGKKKRVWVVGHYDKNGKWTKGHWRRLPKNGSGDGSGNTPDQGNYPGQGNWTGQTGDPLPPADGIGLTTGEPDGGDDYASAGGDEYSDFGGDDYGDVVEDPVLPDLPEDDGMAPEDPPADAADEPGDDFGQAPEAPPAESSDQAGQAGQAGQAEESEESDQASQAGQTDQIGKYQDEVSLRTMGMLMSDLVKDSEDITSFRQSAYSDPNMNFSIETSDNVNNTYKIREQNADLLVRVIVWDLSKNNGLSGKYFSFFSHRMDTLDPESRKLISDVIERVREGVKHNANHAIEEDVKKAFDARMNEISNY